MNVEPIKHENSEGSEAAPTQVEEELEHEIADHEISDNKDIQDVKIGVGETVEAIDETSENAEDIEDAEDQNEDLEFSHKSDTPSLTAVMHYGGKQYVIHEGRDIVLPTQKNPTSIDFNSDQILMAKKEDKIVVGTPYINGASASLIHIGPVQIRREINFKRRRRKNSSKRTKGIRIYSIRCRVLEISIPEFVGKTEFVENTA